MRNPSARDGRRTLRKNIPARCLLRGRAEITFGDISSRKYAVIIKPRLIKRSSKYFICLGFRLIEHSARHERGCISTIASLHLRIEAFNHTATEIIISQRLFINLANIKEW